MMTSPRLSSIFPISALVTAATLPAQGGAFDWPQWQGPNRDAISAETGLLQQWPEGGPALAWKVTDLGGGYGAPAIVDGVLFGMSKREGEEYVWARSEKDGSPIWEQKLGAAEEGGMRQGIEGTGCTPTVDGNRVYVIGHGGDVVCLGKAKGEVLWRRHMVRDFGGRLPTWRFNESPLIDGDKLVCTPGGTETTMVALDKMSGEVVWKSLIPDDANANPGAGTPPGSPAAAARTDAAEEPEASAEGAADFEPAVLVAAGSEWAYFDKGRSPGDGWMESDFDDAAWARGAAELGYGDRDEATTISSAAESYPTYYFRREFAVEDPGSLKPLVVRMVRDDGAVVYLNGLEIVRDNLPDGGIEHGTLASEATPAESGFHVFDLPADKLVAGRNVVAIEVHQSGPDSSDVSFDLEMREKIPGRDRIGPPRPERRRGGFGGFGGGGFGESGAAYSSAIAIDAGSQRQYVQFTSKTVAGVAAADGRLLWRYDKPANRGGINCSTPIHLDGHVFAASAYGSGGGKAKLVADGSGGFKAEEVWFSSNIENHHGGMVVIDGCLYGANGGNGGGYLVCLDFETGEVLWNEGDQDKRRARKGSIAYADGRIYYRTEEGDVLLIEPSRSEFIERGRFEQPDRTRSPAWTHPVVANGRLYIRDQETLFCYDVARSGS